MKFRHYVTVLLILMVSLLGTDIDNTYAHEGHQHNYQPTEDVISQGSFTCLQAGIDKKVNVSGWVQMVRRADGTTVVFVYLEGLAPNTTYPAHVHQLSCALGGGGHYKINPDAKETGKDNEIWPTIRTDAKGVGRGNVVVGHWARSDAQSIVIHDPNDKSKIACADIFFAYSQAVSDF